MEAQKIKDINGWQSTAALYKLSEPLDGAEYVVVSAVDAFDTGIETYIFPADDEGNITDWEELDGSYKGGLSHEQALEDAGYTITEAQNEDRNQ